MIKIFLWCSIGISIGKSFTKKIVTTTYLQSSIFIIFIWFCFKEIEEKKSDFLVSVLRVHKLVCIVITYAVFLRLGTV